MNRAEYSNLALICVLLTCLVIRGLGLKDFRLNLDLSLVTHGLDDTDSSM